MSIDEMKSLANRLSDALLEGFDEHFKVFDETKDLYEGFEAILVIKLSDIYYECKKGLIDKDSCKEKQNQVIEAYCSGEFEFKLGRSA